MHLLKGIPADGTASMLILTALSELQRSKKDGMKLGGKNNKKGIREVGREGSRGANLMKTHYGHFGTVK